MSSVAAREVDGALVVDVLVQPRASRAGVGPVVGDRLRVSVTAPPVDGKANAAVVEAVAEAFGVRPAAPTIVARQPGPPNTRRPRPPPPPPPPTPAPLNTPLPP